MSLQYQLINGNSADELKKFPDNHFDSVVTDPPYGINFLGKEWDTNTGEEEVYRQCLRVLKPGGHLIAFSAARTYHHLAMAVERSGFEIRDQIMWVYGSGFPKSQDVGRQIQRSLGVKEYGEERGGAVVSGAEHAINGGFNGGDNKSGKFAPVITTDDAAKQWSGWGTQLKPAHEPCALAQKPFKDAIYKNVQRWGVGAINVDGCRVGSDEEQQGRFPANFIHDGSDEVVAMFPGEDDNSAARFFYQAKVSRAERNIGCEEIEPKFKEAANFRPNHMEKALNGEDGNPFGRYQPINNNHPTVKPVALMKYLVTLVTPPGGKVLDPFNGSGSTGMACAELGMDYTGIELDPHYIEISRRRIEAWYNKTHPQTPNPFGNDLFQEEEEK
jgi:site-specific DNA-methyltransferase (adenine-specific)